jgi:enamine deaminase RidA (YjgF/YER057c/UK114 family)
LIEQQTAALQCAYLSFERLRESFGQAQQNMLGAVCFSPLSDRLTVAASGMPLAHVALSLLDLSGNEGSICEAWSADGAFTYGSRGQLRYGHNEDILFGLIQLPEADFDTGAILNAGKTPLQQAAESAYRTLFGLIDELNFPHVLRVWNYIADINGSSHGSERYRQFNTGRQDGFLGSGRNVTGSVPAASAVGFREGPLTIYFLAARDAEPIVIENPRQVSAYKYPEVYGPRSPTFSRGSVARLGSNIMLFLSGTASIVGHETLHAGDAVAQTRETMANVAAMVGEANRVVPQAEFRLADLHYKVYVRHEKNFPAIRDELRHILGQSARLMFLRADICRAGLAMEIEATAGHPLDFPPDA